MQFPRVGLSLMSEIANKFRERNHANQRGGPVLGLPESRGGWYKSIDSPVLGGSLGSVFDVTLMRDGDVFKMWFSWRSANSIGFTQSMDGINWEYPRLVLSPADTLGWATNVNRPTVLKKDCKFEMWFTGQTDESSFIGYAQSPDGIHWTVSRENPVLVPSSKWERSSVMCPHVLWDEERRIYQMWYSGGEIYEPNAIGYAVSADGIVWSKPCLGPVFEPCRSNPWEQERVTGCQIIRFHEWYIMFYIGFYDINRAQICMARSLDGIHNWERYPLNPIVSPSRSKEGWDYNACYKPFAILVDDKWMLWYNGRRGNVEQIGLAIHEGEVLWIE